MVILPTNIANYPQTKSLSYNISTKNQCAIVCRDIYGHTNNQRGHTAMVRPRRMSYHNGKCLLSNKVVLA